MAALYGAVQGNRGEATRTGSQDSGIRAYVQTWDARVSVTLEADGWCTVVVNDWQRGRPRHVLYEGNVENLVAEEVDA